MKTIDWESVELQYRTGIRSLKSIGGEFGVSDAGILKHARRESWARDLSARIKARTDEKLTKAALTKPLTKDRVVSEYALVEASSDRQASTVISHRNALHEARAVGEAQIRELAAPSTIASLSLPVRASIFRQLTAGLAIVIDKERQAEGIDKGSEGRQSLGEWLEALT